MWFRDPGPLLPGNIAMLWLYLHFPHLLLDHIRRSREEAGALVIVEGSGQKVIQACPEARDQGVHAACV